jgi:hypothetical protein
MPTGLAKGLIRKPAGRPVVGHPVNRSLPDRYDISRSLIMNNKFPAYNKNCSVRSFAYWTLNYEDTN